MASQNLAAMLQQGKAAEVERICLQEFKKRGGIEFQMLSYYVQATVSLGKIDQTIELLKNMSAKMPDHGGLQDQLARLYSMKGDMDLALEHSDMAIAKAPDVPDFYNGRGNLFKYMNRFEEAREAYQKTVELGPQLPMAHLNLGRVLLKLERFEEAEKCFARALELSGDELALYSGYVGSEFAAIEQYDKARQMYAKGLEQYPEDGFLHEYMGMALRRLSRFEEADAAFRTAARIHPEKSSVYNHWALLKRDNGDFDGAEDLFQKAIKLDEKNAQAYSNYAALMRRKGDLTRANELYEVSLEIAPDAINTHCARAKIHKFEKGDAAFRDLARLLGNEWLSDFDRAKLQLALAKAMEDVGNYPAAFDLASKANVQFKKLRPFDIDKHKNYLVRVAEKFPKASALPPAKPELPRLIQIVGMSRSGKSLVEEVLCHSPEVFGLDEDKGFITEMNAFLGAEAFKSHSPIA
ncbi:tetratricopeptide repeat protein [Sneathiella glossodoripedis]|uniref:tetratricopeptide repeat protein n=1 Tax=Sneathiella glossodoripedis TaxID=418853 RepID=UPI0004702E66|nr:tetratricopeptide repeat protein [Sneathiella glossodoripedis]